MKTGALLTPVRCPADMFHHAGLKRRLNGMSVLKLHDAVRHGRHDLVQQLLAAGADVEATDQDGETPLFYAARLNPVHVNLESHKVVQTLLAAGANVHATDESFRSVLHSAAQRGRHDMVQQLLAAGVRDSFNWTPLFHAIQGGHSNMVQVLLAQVLMWRRDVMRATDPWLQ
jgi:ankyrin repeat protein